MFPNDVIQQLLKMVEQDASITSATGRTNLNCFPSRIDLIIYIFESLFQDLLKNVDHESLLLFVVFATRYCKTI